MREWHRHVPAHTGTDTIIAAVRQRRRQRRRLWRLDILFPVREHKELLLGWWFVFDGQQWMRKFPLLRNRRRR